MKWDLGERGGESVASADKNVSKFSRFVFLLTESPLCREGCYWVVARVTDSCCKGEVIDLGFARVGECGEGIEEHSKEVPRNGVVTFAIVLERFVYGGLV